MHEMKMIDNFTSWKYSLPVGAALPRSLFCLEKIGAHLKACASCMVEKQKLSGLGLQTACKVSNAISLSAE
jgi:hypothetical protein